MEEGDIQSYLVYAVVGFVIYQLFGKNLKGWFARILSLGSVSDLSENTPKKSGVYPEEGDLHSTKKLNPGKNTSRHLSKDSCHSCGKSH